MQTLIFIIITLSYSEKKYVYLVYLLPVSYFGHYELGKYLTDFHVFMCVLLVFRAFHFIIIDE